MSIEDQPPVDEKLWKQVAPLIDAWRDGTLTGSEREHLVQLLRQDAHLRRQIVSDLGLQALLRENLQQRPDASRLAENVLRIVANSQRLRVQEAVINFPNRQHWFRQAAPWVAAAAMLLLGVFTVTAMATKPTQPVSIIAVNNMTDPMSVSSGQQASVMSGTILAGPTRDLLTPFTAGDTISLPSEVVHVDGLARVSLPNKSVIELQPGSRCALSSAASNIVMHHGTIQATLTDSRWLLTPHTLGWVSDSTVKVSVNEQQTTTRCLAGTARFDSWSGTQKQLKPGTSEAFSQQLQAVPTRLVVLASMGNSASHSAPTGRLQLAAGKSHVFSVQVRDQFDRPMDHADMTSWAASGGTLQQSTGASVRFTASGAGPATIIVNHAGLTARQNIKVTP